LDDPLEVIDLASQEKIKYLKEKNGFNDVNIDRSNFWTDQGANGELIPFRFSTSEIRCISCPFLLFAVNVFFI